MNTYIIKFRYPGCETYFTLEGSSKKEVVTKFKKLRVKPHTLADFYIVRSWCGRSIFLSCKEFEKYIVKSEWHV